MGASIDVLVWNDASTNVIVAPVGQLGGVAGIGFDFGDSANKQGIRLG